MSRVPLAFYSGVLVGVLAAVVVFVGVLLSWALWIIRSIGG